MTRRTLSRPVPRVTVVKKARFRFLTLRYRDPITGNERIRSAGTNNPREAEREAAKWEAELQCDPLVAGIGEVPFGQFSDMYEREHLRSLKDSSIARAVYVLEAFEESARPGTIGAVSPLMITRWASTLRDDGLSESTIASYLKQLHAAFAWGAQNQLVAAVPIFPKVRRAKTGAKARVMKGRPISAKEFCLMLRATSAVVGSDRAKAWRRYLRGLWYSGLRLAESIDFWWDRPERLSIDLTGRRPMLRVPAESEKGNRDRLLPITPDFAAFLERTPPAERRGPVFPIPRSKQSGELPSRDWVSHTITAIGLQSGIVVDEKTGKFASAHDLRRSFGARWAPLVFPQVLMELMRHESIETTLRYYVGRQAEQTADAVYSAWSDKMENRNRGQTGGQ